MKKNTTVIIVAICAIVAIAAVAIYAISRGNTMDNMMTNNNATKNTDSSLVNKESTEYATYSKLSGDDYDRMFIANMIAHHQGAVDMAKLARSNAKHQELKDMAGAIITTQTKEITDMEAWQKAWSYPVSSGSMMEDHSAMGMMHDMDSMSTSLEGLSGDAFDKAFLTSMIAHHQSALDMAYPGIANAKHDEVKTLTQAIVTAQSNEIVQMRQWQKDWGY